MPFSPSSPLSPETLKQPNRINSHQINGWLIQVHRGFTIFSVNRACWTEASAEPTAETTTMAVSRFDFKEESAEVDVNIWKEALFGVDIFLLHTSPICYGLGVPHGDGSAVVLIPGFLGTDRYLTQLQTWLRRIGYTPYLSGIGINADCPNLLIQYKLISTIEQAFRETGRKVHIIGHSLGGIIGRSIASQMPDKIASVITLGSPFRGTVLQRSILQAAEAIRENILRERGRNVLPTCYTAKCTCSFLNNLRRDCPDCVMQTAIYTIHDGIVDWKYCRTGDCDCDFEVPGTHMGLVFNATAYKIIAERLARAAATQRDEHPANGHKNGNSARLHTGT